jgi:L-xylulokinase
MQALFLGIDCGSTSTKAALVTADGRVVANVSSPTPRQEQDNGFVERDAEDFWQRTAGTVRRLLAESGRDPADIVSVGAVAHGDGVYFVDEAGAPVGPATLSSDTRAAGIVNRWEKDGTLAAARALSGQAPFPGSPAPLLAWFQRHEPERLERTRWILSSKDWIRFRLTGVVATDRTDASAGFTDVYSHDYSAELARLFGLSGIVGKLPPIVEPTDVVGTVTAAGAAATGLPQGIPVVAGGHDVIACLLATTGADRDRICVVAGTFGVNAMLVDVPTFSPLVNCRSGPWKNTWVVRRTSRASVTNLEWAIRRLALDGADRQSPDIGTLLDAALGGAEASSMPLYVPYLFGGSGTHPRSAGFVGLRSWHDEVDMLRAVAAGIAFSHRADINKVRPLSTVTGVNITGGASRNDNWMQLFADVLAIPVTVTRREDAGVVGAAIFAAVGSGAYSDLESAVLGMRTESRTFLPVPARTRVLDRYFRAYEDVVERLGTVDLDELVKERQ